MTVQATGSRHTASPAAGSSRMAPLFATQRKTSDEKTEERIDEGLEESFPASDPPAIGGDSRITPPKPSDKRDKHDKRTPDTPSPPRDHG